MREKCVGGGTLRGSAGNGVVGVGDLGVQVWPMNLSIGASRTHRADFFSRLRASGLMNGGWGREKIVGIYFELDLLISFSETKILNKSPTILKDVI